MNKSFLSTSLSIITLTAMLSACSNDEPTTNPVPPDDNCRYPTATSSPMCDKVYEYTPAPGQFINESSEQLSTPAQAASWAQQRLDDKSAVSLGGFGGYIVVGFDHSIIAPEDNDADGYDFTIFGNAFVNRPNGEGGSNEPGIVYVMQDCNGNGLPDDTWYELSGTESGKESTIYEYAVTYYRPEGAAQAVRWTDNRGQSGTIDYVAAFHKQSCYYPAWITEDSYTLTGTCLGSRSSQTANGMWNNSPYGGGYVDNIGVDNISTDEHYQCNRFRISDAKDADGKDAKLKYIDFIKVQTGVNAKAGILGEVSTEVLGFKDLTLTK